MQVFELCRDRGDPRVTCRGNGKNGWTCRCEGRYQPRNFTITWWLGPGDQITMCPGCGTHFAGPRPRVTTFVACSACRTEWRVQGRWLPTLLWRLFGKHEGYNHPSLWRAPTRYAGAIAEARMT